MLLLPIVASVLTVWICTSYVPAPADRIVFWVWMAGLVAVSCMASFAAQRLLRKLAPLELLFKMSLIFPDEAPTRFGLALRTGTYRSLARRVSRSDGKAGDAQVWAMQRWAELLVAAMSSLNRHDRLTAGHSERVRAYSVMLGQEIGLPPDELDRLNWAALIHDVGKLDMPSEILTKPDQPTPQEWAVLRGHPGAGWRYVDPLRPWLGDWVDATTQHHERWDGTGYPLGLAGHDISLAGRIVAIADAFDVMTAARTYKKPLPAEQARAELTRNSGTQFDPHLVRSFLQISLGRMRRVIGPLGVLAHFPDFVRVPLAAALSSTTAVMTAGAIIVGATAGAAAPREIDPHNSSAESSTLVDAGDVRGPPIPDSTVTIGANLGAVSVEMPTAETAATSVSPTPSTALDATATATNTLVTATPPPSDMTTPRPPADVTQAPTPTITPAPAPTGPTPPAPSGDLPPALDDAATTRVGQKVSIHVLANDDVAGSGIDAATLTVTVEPVFGTAKVAGQNLLYEPAAGFVGTDTMSYRVCTTLGACDTATVTVTVTH